MASDGWGSGHNNGFMWGYDPGTFKEVRQRRKFMKQQGRWQKHKDALEETKRRKVDYKGILEEWCKKHDKGEPKLETTTHKGFHVAYTSVVEVDGVKYNGARKYHKAEADEHAYFKACEALLGNSAPNAPNKVIVTAEQVQGVHDDVDQFIDKEYGIERDEDGDESTTNLESTTNPGQLEVQETGEQAREENKEEKEEEDEDLEPTRKKKKKSTNRDTIPFKNDGSFLEMFKKMQAEKGKK
eukprot:m.111536 g.111536  ORF g.111536 m.111536 type:complete len:241 (+) comp14063_c0_seq17:158-880(+)